METKCPKAKTKTVLKSVEPIVDKTTMGIRITQPYMRIVEIIENAVFCH